MEDRIAERVMEIFAERCGRDLSEITYESRLNEELGIDSLDAVELLMELEDEFGISAPDEDVEKLATVGDVIEYLRRRMGGDDGGAGVGAKLKGPRKPPEGGRAVP